MTVPSLLSLSNTMNSSFSQSTSSSRASSARLNSPSDVTIQLPSSTLTSSCFRSASTLQPSSSNDQQHQSHQNGINILTSRSRSRDESRSSLSSPPVSPVMKRGRGYKNSVDKEKEKLKERASRRREMCKELSKSARKENDAMVYLDGPRIYTCGECRTHLTSHDEIISKSFHGRHGTYCCVSFDLFPSFEWLIFPRFFFTIF